MGGVSFSLDVEGSAELVAALEALARQARDTRPMMRAIGAMLEASTQQRFQDEAGPDGAAWPSLAAATLRRRDPQAPKLRLANHLYDSLSHRAARAEARVGVNRVYGRIHQLGGEAGRRGQRVTIPARPYLGVSDADRQEIAAIARDHLQPGSG